MGVGTEEIVERITQNIARLIRQLHEEGAVAVIGAVSTELTLVQMRVERLEDKLLSTVNIP